MSWYRQPLLHFLLIGGLFFAVYAWVHPAAPAALGTSDRSIRISTETVATLKKQYMLQVGRPPSDAELKGLVDGFVREEILYREAVSLGLDRDDTIVRRRMVQKMEFLAIELARDSEPSDTALQAWLDAHREQYRRPETLSFTHVYFSKDLRRGKEREQAETVLILLKAYAVIPARAPELGDPFPAGYDFSNLSAAEVERAFGKVFAHAVFGLETGVWSGPVESSYGQHLVRVLEKHGSRLPTLDEVRLDLRRDSLSEGRTKAEEEFYQRLRERYSIVLEEASIAGGQ